MERKMDIIGKAVLDQFYDAIHAEVGDFEMCSAHLFFDDEKDMMARVLVQDQFFAMHSVAILADGTAKVLKNVPF